MSAAPQLTAYQFKPGVSGNPGGKPRIPEYLRGIRALNQTELCLLISKYGRLTRDELAAVAADAKTPVIEASIISVFQKVLKDGSFQHLQFILDRAIGAAPKAPEHPEEIALRQELAQLSNEQLLKIIKADKSETEEKAPGE